MHTSRYSTYLLFFFPCCIRGAFEGFYAVGFLQSRKNVGTVGFRKRRLENNGFGSNISLFFGLSVIVG